MSKLDWSKAGFYENDPARVQRADDFVEPDPVIVSVRDLTAREKKDLARRKSPRGKARAKLKAELKHKPKASRSQPKRHEVTDEEKQLAVEARRIAKFEHHQRYLAKARRQLAAALAKKKSHLEEWVEKQRGLRSDRQALRQTWRAKMLLPPEEE